MRYMVSIGKLGSDPSRDISRDIFTKQTKRNYAHQTDPRIIREVYAAICLPYRGYATVKNAIILLALTFLRANELAGLKWSEVDMEHRRLRIEAERMKMKREHIAPLSHQAISIIEQQRQFMIGSQFVFPSWLNQHDHISTQSLLQGMRRLSKRPNALKLRQIKRWQLKPLRNKPLYCDFISTRYLQNVNRSSIKTFLYYQMPWRKTI